MDSGALHGLGAAVLSACMAWALIKALLGID